MITRTPRLSDHNGAYMTGLGERKLLTRSSEMTFVEIVYEGSYDVTTEHDVSTIKS